MLNQNDIKKQLPIDIFSVFSELKIFYFLRKAGITKQKGHETAFLFTVLFALVFKGKTLNQLLTGREAEEYVGKDSFYRFMNSDRFHWRNFLGSLSAFVIDKTNRLTNSRTHIRALIIDDTSYSRNRSKQTGKLAWLFDHALNKTYKGYRLLTLGYTDGHSFFPIDFALLSGKRKVSPTSVAVDRRTSGGKRLAEADRPMTTVAVELVERALNHGIYVKHVLMDKWFTSPKMIRSMQALGVDVIGMVKNAKTKYLFQGKLYCLSDLFEKATREEVTNCAIISAIRVTLPTGEPIKIVFVHNHNKHSEWLAILSSDITLSSQEIVKVYGARWDIEVFFKATKSLLNLAKECQSRNYHALICHTTIVFTRFIILSWQNRCHSDIRTFGGFFMDLCDELQELDWAVALQELTQILLDVADQASKRIQEMIKCQLTNWLDALPSYIKAYLPNLVCET